MAYILFIYSYEASKTVSEDALFSHEAGRHFILNLRVYCSFHFDEAGILNVFVLFGNCE